ncbi:hypothetical protein PENTCL1PPCAC_20831, partial [Pristionchus entomophagus]
TGILTSCSLTFAAMGSKSVLLLTAASVAAFPVLQHSQTLRRDLERALNSTGGAFRWAGGFQAQGALQRLDVEHVNTISGREKFTCGCFRLPLL